MFAFTFTNFWKRIYHLSFWLISYLFIKIWALKNWSFPLLSFTIFFKVLHLEFSQFLQDLLIYFFPVEFPSYNFIWEDALMLLYFSLVSSKLSNPFLSLASCSWIFCFLSLWFCQWTVLYFPDSLHKPGGYDY